MTPPSASPARMMELLQSANVYAGIGSRRTPPEALRLMEQLGFELGKRGVMLRSGGAPGADTAFEAGCDRARGPKEIYLPWRKFNDHPSPIFTPSDGAEFVASLCHPNWRACTSVARKLHARNCHQIAGRDLLSLVDFVLYWAPCRDGVIAGGTATAITLARKSEIPIFNLSDPEIAATWWAVIGASDAIPQ